MTKRTGVLIAAATALLTACSSSPKSDEGACRAAMQKQFSTAMSQGSGAQDASRPAACAGLDDKTVQKIAEKIIGDAFSSPAT